MSKPGNTLKPFWSYYGGKWRAAPHYPAPLHDTIVEPFAGAAGYSLRYPDRRIILVEKYPVIAEMWRYLIGVTADEIRRIPIIVDINDLPPWVPSGGRSLVGFNLNQAVTAPRKTASKRVREGGVGWSEQMRERIAFQVGQIRHWQVIEGDYSLSPDITATWFVDPPYQAAGKYYEHPAKNIDFMALGSWCRQRQGQVMVCENAGATWLPFRPFMTLRSTLSRVDQDQRESFEMLWEN